MLRRFFSKTAEVFYCVFFSNDVSGLISSEQVVLCAEDAKRLYGNT